MGRGASIYSFYLQQEAENTKIKNKAGRMHTKLVEDMDNCWHV
jgi:hypothetical protein